MAPALISEDQASVILAPALLGELLRGDLVIFRFPGENAPKSTIVSRVVGVAGDRVEVRKGVLLVNGRSPTFHRRSRRCARRGTWTKNSF